MYSETKELIDRYIIHGKKNVITFSPCFYALWRTDYAFIILIKVSNSHEKTENTWRRISGYQNWYRIRAFHISSSVIIQNARSMYTLSSVDCGSPRPPSPQTTGWIRWYFNLSCAKTVVSSEKRVDADDVSVRCRRTIEHGSRETRPDDGANTRVFFSFPTATAAARLTSIQCVIYNISESSTKNNAASVLLLL